ncbi:repetin [Desmodus rotundus]|uniref:repetin n=1 Tax=Desmodus rotundus TaxID=9430 RepID=UPI0023810D77|nr:repetin [Desmodus rotundus]XP_045039061.2 repetin [Desmodus rotundus]
MAQLLNSILTVIKVFQKHANGDGDRALLCKKELKQLLLDEFGNILRRPNDPETVETILSLLDKDRNGHVDFQEYLLLVFQLTQACYHKLENKSHGDRTSQQEEKQEETEDHKFIGNAGRRHRQRHEGERQDFHHSQSERQNQDIGPNQTEKQDRDSHYSQSERQDQGSHHGRSETTDRNSFYDHSERQGQDSSSGQRLSHKSSSGQPERQEYIFALNPCEKQVQSEILKQQSSYRQPGRLGEDSCSSQTNQQESGSYYGHSVRLDQESGCHQRDRQELDSQYGQTYRQGESSHCCQTDRHGQSYHYGQTDRHGQSSHHGHTDRQGQSSHYGHTDRQGLSSQYDQRDTQGQGHHYGHSDRQGQSSRHGHIERQGQSYHDVQTDRQGSVSQYDQTDKQDQTYRCGHSDRQGQSSQYSQPETGETGQNRCFQGSEETSRGSYVEQSGRSGRPTQQTQGQNVSLDQGQRFESRVGRKNSHQAWEPEEDKQHHQHKLVAQIQQERPHCHKGSDWQLCSSEQGHSQAQTKESCGEGQSHQAEEEQGHQNRGRHGCKSQETPCEEEYRQTHEEEQSHQTQNRQTHEDKQHHQKQNRQTHEEDQNGQQQQNRQTHKKRERYQRSQDQQSHGTQQGCANEKFLTNEDVQSQGSQGRHKDIAFYPTQSGGRPQRREEGESHPTKAALAPNPLYDYLQEQRAHWH